MAQQMTIMGPSDQNRSSITIGGRSYSCALGSTVMVDYQTGLTALANGWTATSTGGSGPTAQRPANPTHRDEFHDTDLQAIVRFDGKNWRHSLTGAVV